MATFNFDPQGRTPWNNIIYPGNYITHLNSYREQGVVALPGVVFFRLVGALVLNPDNFNVLDENGELPAGSYDLQILSPDMRQDDKPRKDRVFKLPAGAIVYRTSISAPGVREADGIATAGVLPGTTTIVHSVSSFTPTLTANDGTTVGRDGTLGFFNPVGEFNDEMLSIVDGASTAGNSILDPDSALKIQIVTSAALTAEQNPTAGACRKSPSAIILEVCYFLPDAAPDTDDLHIPYAIEEGQDQS